MNNKASLELSVNAIVILIIALVVLGLVIAFVVTKFSSISEGIRVTETTPAATPDIPLQFPGGSAQLTLEKTKTTLMEIRIYASDTALKIKKGLFFDCSGPETPLKYELRTTELDVPAGTEKKIPVSIKLNSAAKIGTYACSVNVYDQDTSANPSCWDGTNGYSSVNLNGKLKSSDCYAANPAPKLILSVPVFIIVK